MYDDELMHFGVKGMKWGRHKRVSKGPYHSRSLKAYRARRANEKVDDSFKQWQNKSNNKADAIAKGKKMNASRLAYETNRSNPEYKRAYKNDRKEYKKALKKNTTYHKGAVRSEVGSDASRKYLSEAKKVKKGVRR